MTRQTAVKDPMVLRWLGLAIGCFWAPLVFALGAEKASASAPPPAFACGGEHEQEVWRLWDSAGAEEAGKALKDRLFTQGDTYVLYDLQTQLQNLHAMAVRCQRPDRQRQIATVLSPAFQKLEAQPKGGNKLAWICKGGRVCNQTNRLQGTEVLLVSVQFLAFVTTIANEMGPAPEGGLEPFSAETARIAASHLSRWSSLSERLKLRKRISSTPDDVKDGSSALFLTDKDLWQIVMYANLAGLLERYPALEKDLTLSDDEWQTMREHVSLLLQLVKRRTILGEVAAPNGERVAVANLDAGYWRLYKDMRYAGYASSEKPAVCSAAPGEKAKLQINVEPDSVPVVKDLGWDFSHARRLVHFFPAVLTNAGALQRVFGVGRELLPLEKQAAAFAMQLKTRVWNQDPNYPLFTNFFNGANGWYRVAYDIGTGDCREGQPPYSLTDSFATGGYAVWSRYIPELQNLGERIFSLTTSTTEEDRRFIDTYYRGFSGSSSERIKLFTALMFVPSLIHPTLAGGNRFEVQSAPNIFESK